MSPILVAGFGRCGTTMVMSMLDRGGVPVACPAPGYEKGSRLTPGFTDTAWLLAQKGRALKWLDPMASFTPQARFATILWLDRDPDQQARSQCKLLGISDRRVRRAMKASLKADRPRALAVCRSRGPTLVLRFEDILANHDRAAAQIALHLRDVATLDVEAAAGAVHDRGPDCLPDLSFELGARA